MTDKKHKNKSQINHKMTTRRDFLAQGVIKGSAMTLIPSTLVMASNKAMGAVDPAKCVATGGVTKRGPAFLAIDCAGGANLLGSNFIVGGKGGQGDFLAPGSYASIGLPTAFEPPIITPDTSYGVAMHPNSGILAGLNAAITDPAIKAKIAGVVACAQTGDDTATNPLNVNQLIAAISPPSGLVGNIGVRASASGGRHAVVPASINPMFSPVILNRPEDALSLVDPGLFTAKQAEAVIKAASRMSDVQLTGFQAKTVPEQIKVLMNCGYVSGSGFLSKFTPDKLSATADPRITAIFPGIATDGNQGRLATLTKLLIDGNASAGTYEIGGCDYHGQGTTTQNAKNVEIGTAIGRFFRACAAASVPGMVFITTDGGVSASGGASNSPTVPFFAFNSDNGQRSGAVIMAYDPVTRPNAIAGNQIGAYTANGSCDTTSSPLAGSASNLGLWAASTYAGLLGQADKMSTFLSGNNPLAGMKDSGAAFGNVKA